MLWITAYAGTWPQEDSFPVAQVTDGRQRQGGEEFGGCVWALRPGRLHQRGSMKAAEHPHLRGEDYDTDLLWNIANGAPPRAWAGRLCGWHRARLNRSTPTCVGRTYYYEVVGLA